MRSLFGMLSALVVYFCIGTVITGGLVVGYAASKGFLSSEKVSKMLAVAKGTDGELDVSATLAKADGKSSEIPEQPSLAEIETKRALHTRNLELREQAVTSSLARVRFEQIKLVDEKENYDRLKSSFEKQLADLHSGSQATGRENIRQIWESIRPKQAKEQVLQMLAAGEQNDVVAIFIAMPVAKRAKIIGEFKSEDDSKKLEEVLRLIRLGEPESKVVDKASEQVKQTSNTPPRTLGNASNQRAEVANSGGN